MRLIAIVLAFSMLLVTGCAYSVQQGRVIDRAKISQIVPGETKADTLVSALGKPDRVLPLKSGEEKYIYNYYKDAYRHWWTLSDAETQRLEAIVVNGVVEKISLIDQSVTRVPEKTNLP